jgi:hypothetical protein
MLGEAFPDLALGLLALVDVTHPLLVHSLTLQRCRGDFQYRHDQKALYLIEHVI